MMSTLHFMMRTHNDDFKLNDLIINAAQTILKKQFPKLMGLQMTLLLKKPQPRFQDDKPYVQIIFDKKDHALDSFFHSVFKKWSS